MSLCLSIKRFNEQCIEQSYHRKQFYKESAKLCHELIPYVLAPASIMSVGTGHLCLVLGLSPSTYLQSPKVASSTCTTRSLWEKAAAFLISSARGTSLPTRSCSVPGISVSPRLSPSCSQTFLLSVPEPPLVTSYHCQVVTV